MSNVYNVIEKLKKSQSNNLQDALSENEVSSEVLFIFKNDMNLLTEQRNFVKTS